jgi:hypothetical protein
MYICFQEIPVQGKWRPDNMTSKANNLTLSDDEVAGVWFVDALGSDHTLLMHEWLGIKDADYNYVLICMCL